MQVQENLDLTQAQTEPHWKGGKPGSKRLPDFKDELILREMFDIPMVRSLYPATSKLQRLVEDYGADEENLRMTLAMSNHAWGLLKPLQGSDENVSLLNPWGSESLTPMKINAMKDHKGENASLMSCCVF